MAKTKRLGRGLGALSSGSVKLAPKPVMVSPEPAKIPLEELKPVSLKGPTELEREILAQGGRVVWLDMGEIIPNRFQPRKEFDEEGLKELTDSIKSAGVIQPVIVRKAGEKYELIAGERRWRACRNLNISRIPALIKEADDKTVLEWAIIENTQRQDLNPVERGRAYQELADMFKLTHEEIAERVGIARPTVSNFIRLLELPKEVQDEVSHGTISMGHARALLSLDTPDLQIKLVRRIKKEGMSVRRLEYVIRYLKRPRTKSQVPIQQTLYLKELEERLRRRLGVKTSITSYKSKGYITIYFASPDDFQRILEALGI